MDKKTFKCITASSMRELINKANEQDVTKEDLVEIICHKPGLLHLVYYK